MAHKVTPERAFVASVTFADGHVITTTIYGSNPDAAERTKALEANVVRVVVRSEMAVR